MYSRPREDFGISLPGDYCGTTFKEEESKSQSCQEDERDEDTGGCVSRGKRDSTCKKESAGGHPILSGLPFLSALDGLGLSLPAFGTEDILIIATAAFLFFSKSGDKECAIMLLLLIFIAN